MSAQLRPRWALAAAVVVPLLLVGTSCDAQPPPAGTAAAGSSAPAARAALPADLVRLAAVRDIAALDLPGTRAFRTGSAGLRGPHFQFTFVATVTTRQLTAKQAVLFGLSPAVETAPGRDLVLAELGPVLGRADAAFYPDGRPDAVEVSVGSRVSPVATTSADQLNGVLAVSVPAGVHPILRVTDAGRPQSLDLVTGRRGRDAAAGYYPLRSADGSAEPNDGISFQYSGPGGAGQPAAERIAQLALDDVPASLQPYVPGRKWARAGRAWLVLEPTVIYWRPSAGASPTATDQVEVAVRSFTLAGPDGAPLPLSGAPISPGVSSTGASVGQKGSGRLVADVPISLRKATLRFSFRGSIRLPNGTVSWTVYHGGSQAAALALT
jgi:hypothetical protein